MVSDFLTAAQGRLAYIDPVSGDRILACEIIKYGKNHDGWWDSEKMIQQVCSPLLLAVGVLAAAAGGVLAAMGVLAAAERRECLQRRSGGSACSGGAAEVLAAAAGMLANN